MEWNDFQCNGFHMLGTSVTKESKENFLLIPNLQTQLTP